MNINKSFEQSRRVMMTNRDLALPVEVEPDTLGQMKKIRIPTVLGDFTVLPEFKTELPPRVVKILEELINEYDEAVSTHLMPEHVESEQDYRHARRSDGSYTSMFYQVDMAALPNSFFDEVERGAIPADDLREILRSRIFEFEDSLAMYGFLRGLGSTLDADGLPLELSDLGERFDATIRRFRERFGAVAVGAITDEKHLSLLATELGVVDATDKRLSDNGFVRAVTGFDAYISPEELKKRIDCRDESALIYARTSPSSAALRSPSAYDLGASEFLSDTPRRLGLRGLALTLNVDNPNGKLQINDTKAALPLVSQFSLSVGSKDFAELSVDEVAAQFGIEPQGKVRVKPEQAYGAYRQRTSSLQSVLAPDSHLDNALRKNPIDRFIIQPEIPALEIKGSEHGDFGGIFRLFASKNSETDKFELIGGIFNLLPTDNDQARKNTFHGNSAAVSAEISVG